MSNFTSQINIIKKIKSLVKKAKKTFQKSSQSSNISEKMALQIQKNAYDISRRQIKETYSPIYKEIAEQLHSTEDQIFRSAVFNLVNIAKNNHFKQEILELLEKQIKSPNITQEQIEYINKKLSQIK